MNQSGIYQIQNLVNGKTYIGSATNLRTRRNKHFHDLEHKVHRNSKLQNSFNKYGIANFEFSIVQLVEPQNLIKVEQWYIDTFDAVENGYNVAPSAQNMLGYRHTAEAKLKMARPGAIHTTISKEKMRLARIDLLKNGNKLNPSDIPNIRKRLLNGEFQKLIACDYSVSVSTISDIKLNRIWTHIK